MSRVMIREFERVLATAPRLMRAVKIVKQPLYTATFPNGV